MAVLIDVCPELTDVWDAEREYCQDGEGQIMFYLVFAQILLPMLAALISGKPTTFDDMYPGLLPSDPKSREELLNRLYQVFEVWAASHYGRLTDLLVHELSDPYSSGEGQFTVDQLLEKTGPEVRDLLRRTGMGFLLES
jgi:hypothetical protein